MDVIKTAAGKLAATPVGKGEKREATSPPVPHEPQHEKKSRNDDAVSEDTISAGGDEDQQQKLAQNEPSDVNVFSNPMHPSDILQIATELRSMMVSELADLIKEQMPNFQQMVRHEVQEATKSLSAQLVNVTAENDNLKQTCSKLEKRVAKLEQDNNASEEYGNRNILRVSGMP